MANRALRCQEKVSLMQLMKAEHFPYRYQIPTYAAIQNKFIAFHFIRSRTTFCTAACSSRVTRPSAALAHAFEIRRRTPSRRAARPAHLVHVGI